MPRCRLPSRTVPRSSLRLATRKWPRSPPTWGSSRRSSWTSCASKVETQMNTIQEDMSTSVTELSDEMNRQFQMAEKRHRQMQDKVSVVEHKLDSGMAGLNGRIAGPLRAATDAQVATLAQLQAQIRSARAGSSCDLPLAGTGMGKDPMPSSSGIPPREARSPYAQEKFSARLSFPFSVAPAHKQQTFAIIPEEVMPGSLRADAVPKFGLSATAMRIEFNDKENMHSFVDIFPGRVYTYVDKGTG